MKKVLAILALVCASALADDTISIAKAFSPNLIQVNQTTTLTFTITVGGPDTLNATFSDNLPSGLVFVFNANQNPVSVCGGTGQITYTTNSVSMTLPAAVVPGSPCMISTTVQAQQTGIFINTTSQVSGIVCLDSCTTVTGTPASDTLTVPAPPAPPTLTKSFGASHITVNATASLTFTVGNPNAVTLSQVAFNDTLPTGLIIATPNGLSTTCSGTATANAGSNVISLSGSSLAVSPATCSVSVNVAGTTAGPKNNTSDPASALESGTGSVGTGSVATATLQVVGPPTITKSFMPSVIPLNGTTKLSFTLTNPTPNAIPLNSVAFSDTLPAGLVIATPNGLTGSCGGTITATEATNLISLATATLAANSSCTFSVNVVATASGSFVNTTGNVSSDEGGTGGSASATVSTSVGAVTVDSQGHVLMALTKSGKVLVFDNKGGSLTPDSAHPFLNPGMFGSISNPTGVAVDSKDNIFVSDTAHNRIIVFTSIVAGAAPVNQITVGAGVALNQPGNLAVDSADHLAALDAGNNRIVLLTILHAANNTVSGFMQLGQIGPTVGILGQFNAPLDVAVDSQDHILVADSGNHRIAVFKSIVQGASPLMQIGPSLGGMLGQLSNPTGVAANLKDPNPTNKDGIAIMDTSATSPRVVLLASIAQGNGARSQIASSAQNGQLNGSVGGLRTALNGNILLLEPGSSRLAEFSDIGTFLFSVPLTF